MSARFDRISRAERRARGRSARFDRAPVARRWEFEFPGGLRAPRAARRLLTEVLADDLELDELHEVHVLVSELVANAVRHAGAGDAEQIGMTVALSDGRLRVEVRDRGAGFARPAMPRGRPDGGGNGFVLLQRLTDDWGVVNGAMTRVWFVRTLSPPAAATAGGDVA